MAVSGPASAHSAVDITFPADGQVLEKAPGEIAMGFNERVTMADGAVSLVDSSGSETQLPAPVVVPSGEGSKATMAPVPDIADGWYAVKWSAVSADGHPVRGTFTFYVGDPTQAASATTVDVADIEDPAELFRNAAPYLRGLSYLATLLAIGGLAGAWAVSSRKHPMPGRVIASARRISAASAVAGLVLAPLGLLLSAVILNGGPSDSLGSTFQLVIQSTTGASLLVRMSAMFAACTAVLLLIEPFTRKVGYAVAVLAGIGAAFSYAMSGHAAIVETQMLSSIAQVLHLVAASFWLGAIPVLLIAAWMRSNATPEAVVETFDRFSKLATVSVLMVLAAGLTLSFQMFQTADEVVTSQYGWSLTAKIGIVSLIALIGAYNHFVAVPALRKSLQPSSAEDHPDENPTTKAMRTLRVTLIAETAGLALVVVATAVLTMFGAPKAEGSHVEHLGFHSSGPSSLDLAQALSDLDPKVASASVSAGELEASYLPGKAGRENRVTIRVYGQNGEIVPLSSMTLKFELPSEQLGPIERTPEQQPDGAWAISTRDLGVPGEWTLAIEFETEDGAVDFAEVPVTIESDTSSTPRAVPEGPAQ